MTGGHDLSGEWRGVYNYPGGVAPPTEFTAVINDAGGLLTGDVSEPGVRGGTAHAAIDGRREGSAVTFAKLYDGALEDYDMVAYQGEVAADGLEISGRWTIPGVWSGSFIMMRPGGVEEEAELRAEEPVE